MGINLEKNDIISLDKKVCGEKGLGSFFMGLGWDPVSSGFGGFVKGLFGSKDIDLDASVVVYDFDGRVVDVVWFPEGSRVSKCGMIRHSGDNRTGKGKGDDERIYVEKDGLSSNVSSLVFTINSYEGHTFNVIENAFCRLVNGDREVVRYDLGRDVGAATGVIMASVFRMGGEWSFRAIGERADGRTVKDILHLTAKFA